MPCQPGHKIGNPHEVVEIPDPIDAPLYVPVSDPQETHTHVTEEEKERELVPVTPRSPRRLP